MLDTLHYQEKDPAQAEGHFDPLQFGSRNLVVGRNASGKTRLLRMIREYGAWLAGGRLPPPGRWMASHRLAGGAQAQYEFRLEEGGIWERFAAGDDFLLAREGTAAWRHSPQAGRTPLPDPGPGSVLASVEGPPDQLRAWGGGIRFHPFSGQGAAGPLSPPVALEIAAEPVLSDMNRLGYPVEAVRQARDGLEFRERGVPVWIAESLGSTALVRSLRFLLFLHGARLDASARCLLVDDLAEGLDYERAGRLCGLLLERMEEWLGQWIVCSNDRQVMNRMPLDYWTLLEQAPGGRVRVINRHTAPALFENFRFTGLSHFDFFSMGFSEAGERE